MQNNNVQNNIGEVYNKLMKRLDELLALEIRIIAKHKKNIEQKKIEQLKEKIQKND